MTRSVAQQRNDRGIQLAFLRQPVVQLAQLTSRRKLPEPQQVAGLFKIRVIGQFVYIDAAIGKNALISVDVADLGVGCDDSLESFGRVICSEARHSISR